MIQNQLRLTYVPEIIGKRLFNMKYSGKLCGSYYISKIEDLFVNMEHIDDGDYFTMEDYSGKQYTMIVYKKSKTKLDCISTECASMIERDHICTGRLTKSVEIQNILRDEFDALPELILEHIVPKSETIIKDTTVRKDDAVIEKPYAHTITMGRIWIPLATEIAKLAPICRMYVPSQAIEKQLWSRIKTYKGNPINWLLDNDEANVVWCMTKEGLISYDKFSEYGIAFGFTLGGGGER